MNRKKSAPSYWDYFTQGESPHFNFDASRYDLSWIDELNKKIAIEKAERIQSDIKNGIDPSRFSFNFEKPCSKDFDDCKFPGNYDWPLEFKVAFDEAKRAAQDKVKDIISEHELVFTFEDLTIYVNCKDGNSYLSTRYYNHGSFEIATLASDSAFDSVETAVYAFINDHKMWQSESLAEYTRNNLLQKLESAREERNQPSARNQKCEHEDLASMGYTHGELVTCPFCKSKTYVW